MCANCGKGPVKTRCAKCKEPYCGPACQKEAWPKHGKVCEVIAIDGADVYAAQDLAVDCWQKAVWKDKADERRRAAKCLLCEHAAREPSPGGAARGGRDAARDDIWSEQRGEEPGSRAVAQARKAATGSCDCVRAGRGRICAASYRSRARRPTRTGTARGGGAATAGPTTTTRNRRF